MIAATPCAAWTTGSRFCWLAGDDRDVRRIARQNLAKQRLARSDPQWVAGWQALLA